MKNFDAEVISALADDAEKLAQHYKSSSSLLKAIRRHILEKFSEAKPDELDEVENRVMRELYDRKGKNPPPPRPSVIRGAERSAVSRPRSYSWGDLAAGAEVEDRLEALHLERKETGAA